MRPLAFITLAVALLSAAPENAKFTGIVTDSMCARGDHSGMRMGPTSAECVIACVLGHDADYVLFDGKEAYTLSNHPMLEKLAGQKVIVTGTLDAKTKTIHVESIAAAR